MLYAGKNLNTLRSLGPINHEEFLNKIESYVNSGVTLEGVSSIYSQLFLGKSDYNIYEVQDKFKSYYYKSLTTTKEIREKIITIIK